MKIWEETNITEDFWNKNCGVQAKTFNCAKLLQRGHYLLFKKIALLKKNLLQVSKYKLLTT